MLSMLAAVQAPVMRFTREKPLAILPTLRRAAEAMARINDDVPPAPPDDD